MFHEGLNIACTCDDKSHGEIFFPREQMRLMMDSAIACGGRGRD